MSDRKYRQRGYQDDRQPAPKAPGQAPAPRPERIGPRTPNLMGFREVLKCTHCGEKLTTPIARDAICPKCSADLHSCQQCASFDPGSRFECQQTLPARVSPKNSRNQCTLFEPKVTIEKETGSSGPPSVRKAFDDLFNF